MSSAEIAASVVRELEPEDSKLLKVFGSGLKGHEALSKSQLAAFSKMHPDIVDFRISKLQRSGLIVRNGRGYSLVMAGLDALALKMLSDRDIVDAMGKPIGVGKESDVYEAISGTSQRLALKFFRIGRTSFRDVQRKRSVGSANAPSSMSVQRRSHHWLMVNIDAAKREFDALERLQLRNVQARIPHVYGRGMHCVVMGRIEGTRLVNVKKLDEPDSVLEQILYDVGSVYGAGIINADLSEYNVLIDAAGKAWIIDWPQSVLTSHPNAAYLIERDVRNLVKFFARRFRCKKQEDQALKQVLQAR
jgi:RIO kinase 2